MDVEIVGGLRGHSKTGRRYASVEEVDGGRWKKEVHEDCRTWKHISSVEEQEGGIRTGVRQRCMTEHWKEVCGEVQDLWK